MSGMEPVDVVYDTVFTLTHTLVETIATLTDMAGTGSYLSEQCANLAVDLENKLASVGALVLTAVEVEQLQELVRDGCGVARVLDRAEQRLREVQGE